MNENVSQSFGLGFENGNSRKNHPCPALLRSYLGLCLNGRPYLPSRFPSFDIEFGGSYL